MTENNVWGLEGKVAIVTGGGSAGDGIGNGRASAILLARAGAKVLVVDRKLELAERTVSMIAAEGGIAAAANYDVTSAAQCEAMVADAVARWGRLDCLDNNVASTSKGSVVVETEENWARVMQVSIDTIFRACKYAIPAMIRTAGGGAIVSLSSIAALRPRGSTVYTVAKGAVIALTQAMAYDHGPDGIRVNCVVVGPVHTPLVYDRGKGMTDEARERRRLASVLQIEGTGWDTGAAVRFLLSDQARYITGHALVVDGGVALVGPNMDTGTK